MNTIDVSKPNLKSEQTCLTTNPTELNLITSQGTSTINTIKKTKSNIDNTKSIKKSKKAMSVKKSKIITLNKLQMYEMENRVKVLALFKARNEQKKTFYYHLSDNIDDDKIKYT